MFSPDQWAASTGVAFYNGVATQSLRFDSGSTTYLNKTFSSAGNQQSWTWSGWVKRSKIGTAYNQHLFGVQLDGSNIGSITFRSNDTLKVNNKTGNTNGDECTTNAVFRDVSAWYHIVVSFDGSQSTQANRTKIYVNGVLQDKVTNLALSAGNGYLNTNAKEHSIGARRENSTDELFDGYIAEMNFVDGQTLNATSFAETKNGVWIPIKYSGSYGTNGFRLQFNQTGTGTASSSTIGADTSGNANHFSSSGIVASDCDMPDSPENNFCTLNTLDKVLTSSALSEGNLSVSAGANAWNNVINSTFSITSGKWYWEVRQSGTGGFGKVGVRQDNSLTSSNTYTAGATEVYLFNGNKQQGSTSTDTSYYGSSMNADGNIFGIAIDMDAGKIWVALNNTYGNSGNPANGTNAMFDNLSDPQSPSFSSYNMSSTFNFGQDSSFAGNETAQGNTDANGRGDFYYSPPSGYLALCTANLPEPTISPNADTQADDYFNTILYTGDGSNTRSITGVGFQPDWVWLKRRSSAQNHRVFDSSRGSTEGLYTNLTDAEGSSQDDNGVLSSFDSDGFSTVNGTLGVNAVNQNNETYVAWNWKANGGTTSSNTDGSITSTVQANTDAGFSIVTYTGTGSAVTVGHSLGTVPSMFIVKRRNDTSGWATYHKNLTSASYYIQVNSNVAEGVGNNIWNQTDPTSSVFTVGTDLSVSGGTYVAYCFAEIEGYSKFGSYTGNGSADGTFVYTGFRPAFVMLKRSDGTSSWSIRDNTRNDENPADLELRADSSVAEYTESGGGVDLLSNGFKCRTTTGGNNASGGTYIYMAFAETPTKYSLGR